MQVKPLSLHCPDCRTPIQIRRIGLTSQRRLVVHCRCGSCKADTYLFQPLDDELIVSTQITDDMTREPDTQFLRSIGVALTDEKEC
jgi:hypothetical protein